MTSEMEINDIRVSHMPGMCPKMPFDITYILRKHLQMFAVHAETGVCSLVLHGPLWRIPPSIDGCGPKHSVGGVVVSRVSKHKQNFCTFPQKVDILLKVKDKLQYIQ